MCETIMTWGPHLLVVLSLVSWARGIDLTFELTDNARECFFQEIDIGTPSSLEYQVLTGGRYDVDVTLHNPHDQMIYRRIKQENDVHHFTPFESGVFTICFSNEFSTFSHKLVYLRLKVGPGPELPLGRGKVMTALDRAAQDIHARLVNITEHQRHYRLREAQGRKRAEDLNDRVKWWSLAETITVVLVTVVQVLALKNLFPDRVPVGV